MKSHRFVRALILCLLSAFAAAPASAASRRIFIAFNSAATNGTITLRFGVCAEDCSPGQCAGAAELSVSVACQQADADNLAAALACAINSAGNPDYSAYLPGEGLLDVYFPDGRCLCIDGGNGPQPLGDGCPAVNLCDTAWTVGIDGLMPGGVPDCNDNAVPDPLDIVGLRLRPHGKFPTGAFPAGVGAGDFSGDGLMDLCTANDSDHDATVLRNEGTTCLSFGSRADYAVAPFSTPRSIAVARLLNNDTALDFAVAGFGDSRVHFFQNNGSGAFTQVLLPGVDLGENANPSALVAVDIDLDTDVDLAASNNGTDDVGVIRNNNGSFALVLPLSAVGLDPRSIAAGDLGGTDNKPELVTASGDFVFHSISILHNTTQGGNITFDPAQTLDPEGALAEPWAVAIADFDNDGRRDIAVTNIKLPQDYVAVILNVGFSNGEFVLDVVALPEVANGAFAITTADFDQDGDVDLATVGYEEQAVTVLENDGTGRDFRRHDFYAAESPQSIVGTDLDGDGDDDITVGNGQSFGPLQSWAYVLLNESRQPASIDCNSNLVPDECELVNCDGLVIGDLTCDGLVNGLDIQPILPYVHDERYICRADIDEDALVIAADVPPFVCLLLSLTPGCTLPPTPRGPIADCNGNDIIDAEDIAEGTSDDCNASGIPDECEQDCNANGVPDDCDIAASTSADCNENTWPDECDIALHLSTDDNENGMPDECEGEGLIGGGESSNVANEPPVSAGAASENTSAAPDGDESSPAPERWNAFDQWLYAHDFSGLSEAETLCIIHEKMAEYGIPSE